MNDFIKDILCNKARLDLLIVGDSIGDGSSSSSSDTKWASLLRNKLIKKYGCECTVTNIAVGGTDSLFGYYALMRINSKFKFDIVIVCYGQNDDETVFPLNYEILLRNIRRKYPEAFMISFLESSQRIYTPKIKSIIALAEKYGSAIVDTVDAFGKSGYNYEQLTVDGIHINDIGASVYADAAFRTVTQELLCPKELCEPENKAVREYDYCRFVPKYEMQYTLADYRIKTKANHIFFACFEAPSADEYTVEINGEKMLEQTFKHNLPFIWERIYPLKSISGVKEVKITLKDETDVNLFIGLLLTGQTEEQSEYSVRS